MTIKNEMNIIKLMILFLKIILVSNFFYYTNFLCIMTIVSFDNNKCKRLV